MLMLKKMKKKTGAFPWTKLKEQFVEQRNGKGLGDQKGFWNALIITVFHTYFLPSSLHFLIFNGVY